MRRFPVVALLMFAPLVCLAQTNAAFLNQIAVSRFVYVTSESGGQSNPSTDPDDRRLAIRVENQLASWKRFIVVHDPSQADIIVSVRAPGMVRPRVGVQVGSRPGPAGGNVPYHGTSVGADAGPKYDLLTVYSASSYPDGAVLWRAQQQDGLSGNMPLVASLEKDVEKAAAQLDKEKDKKKQSKDKSADTKGPAKP